VVKVTPPWTARAYLGACAIACVAYFLVPPKPAAVVYDALGLAAAVALALGGRRQPRASRTGWYLLAAGMVAWVGGDIYWTGYELAGREAPFPSWADASYLCAYPLWTAGLLILVRSRTGRAERDVLIDAGIVTWSAAMLWWVFLIGPQVEAGEPLLTVLTTVAYPLGDLLLVAVAARMLLGPGARASGHRLLLAGMAATLIADVTYMIAVLHDWYRAGLWIDLGWLLIYALWGAAALSRPPAAAAAGPGRPARRSPLVVRLAPVALAALIIAALDLTQATESGGKELVVGIGITVTLVLIAVRVAEMFRTNERDADELAEQGRMLRRALEDLEAVEAERIRLLDQTVRATEEERARVAVELHDGPIQHLTALSFRLGRARSRVVAGDAGRAGESIDRAEQELGEHIAELRRLMRDLRPPALDEGGVEAALRDQIDVFRTGRGISVELDARLDRELDPDSQVVLYRITQEALANVAKHANARSVLVRLVSRGDAATLEVRDDGVGFDQRGAVDFARNGHFGLAGMAQRASMVGGSFTVRSAPGAGTVVRVDVPARIGA
jgi:signal transduction histidine kinase